jgi:O-6-methylguanine DNA methyltransferase
METVFVFHASSQVGPLFLAASDKGLVRLEFEGRVQKIHPTAIRLRESKTALAPYLRELDEYFAGERREFRSPDSEGTEFQLACWNALPIPIRRGKLPRHAEPLAIRAYRAVGMSNNRNPVAIVVPCHRLSSASGSLCVYGGGLYLKRSLLDLEQAKIRPCLPLAIGA